MIVANNDLKLTLRVKQALERISSAREIAGRLVVNVPIMYPSGAMVAVEIERNKDSCFIADMGKGYVESEFHSAQDFYIRDAQECAKQFGVDFDGFNVFAIRVSLDRLESAIVCVANASREAAASAIRHASEIKYQRKDDELFHRVRQIFGQNLVSRSVEIAGRHASWEAHNVVVFPNRSKAVFEYMTGHPNSISSKFLMFSDILQADVATSLNAVVSRIDDLGPKAQIISDVANILHFKASDDEFRSYAQAS